MGQANSIHVQLERDSYFPGDTVRGTAHVFIAECMDCEGIQLKAIGETRTRWYESRSTGQVQYVQHFSGKEVVLRAELMLAGLGVIQPGMFSYPFELILPGDGLPASMEWDQKNTGYKSFGFDGKASTSYFVQAIAKKAGTFSRDIKSEPLPFTVLHRNTVTPSGPITVADAQDSVICCCFKGGSLSGSLTVATDVAEPGSKLSYTAELTNDSKGAIKYVEVKLRQRVTLYGGVFSRKSTSEKQVFTGTLLKETIALSKDQLKPGSKANKFKGDLGPVPQRVPSMLSTFIKVETYVELLAKMGALTKSFRLEAPVIHPPPAPCPYIPPYDDSGMGAEPETSPLLSYKYPKIDAPLDWSPLLFKPASLKLSPGAAVAPADDDDDAEEFFRKGGW